MNKIKKHVLIQTFIRELIDNPFDEEYFLSEFDPVSKILLNEGLVKEKDKKILLTDKGRQDLKVVLTGGVFDLLHEGHLLLLSEAKKLGDVLIVVIATDETVLKNKKRYPINNEKERVNIINSIKHVDLGVIGDKTDFLKVVEKFKPDLIVLGHDQTLDEKMLERNIKDRFGDAPRIIRIKKRVEGKSTSKLISRILSIIQ